MAKKQRPMPRGFVNNIILESLMEDDKYGYEIIKEVEDKTNGEIVIKQPSLYSSLKRFEARGFITSYWGDSDIGGRRHYYSITETGRKHFLSIESESVLTDFEDEEKEEKASSEKGLVQEMFEDMPEIKEVTTNEISLTEPTALNKPEEEKVDSNILEEELFEEDSVDTDSETYDVFNLLSKDTLAKTSENNPEVGKLNEPAKPVLEQQPNKVVETALQKNMFSSNAHESEESDLSVVDTSEVKEELNKLKVNDENEFKPVEVVDTKADKNIPLIEEDDNNLFNDYDDIDFESVEKPVFAKEVSEEKESESEDPSNYVYKTQINITELIEAEKQANKTALQTNSNNTTLINNNQEISQEMLTEPTQAEILIDEFGIIKSSADVAPKKEKTVFDNVGARIKYSDPLNKKNKKNVKAELNSNSTYNNLDVEKFSLTDQDYEQREKSISNKLQNLVTQKFGKIESLDYKNLLGEIYFDEQEIELQKQDNETIKLHDNQGEDELFEYEKSTLKNTPFSALGEALEKDGFKFKPYNHKFSAPKKHPEFLLVNKAVLNFGLFMSIFMLLQIAAFAVFATQISHTFSKIDLTITYLSVAISIAMMVLLSIPFAINPKQRKYNNYKLGTTMVFCLITYLGIALLTYAINSLYGLTVSNIMGYLVALFLPLVMGLNIIVAPLVYYLIVNSKRFY